MYTCIAHVECFNEIAIGHDKKFSKISFLVNKIVLSYAIILCMVPNHNVNTPKLIGVA